jgi:predicted RND superfamily exporter protein
MPRFDPDKYVDFLDRKRKPLIVGSLAVAAVSLVFTVKLFMNLRPDIEELLPSTARSVQDLAEVRSRLIATDSLGILVFSDKPDASKRFVVDLVKKLKEVPDDTIARIDYRLKEAPEFFSNRRALYLDAEDLKGIRNFVRDRIEYETQLYNPLNIFSSREIKEPQFDMNKLRDKYQKRFGDQPKFPDGFFATADEKIRTVLIFIPSRFSRMKTAKKLKSELRRIFAELNPKSYAEDIDIRLTGPIQNLLEEHAGLVEDLGISTAVVVTTVSAAMLFYFQSFFATSALVIALLVGTIWTFGVAFFAVGYLNSNSAFLGSIVLGNGINFGIILLARYLEDRRLGRKHKQSMALAIRATATPTLTAALAAGLSYGSLIYTDFRGFRQFGLIGLIGMVLCWLASFCLLPAILSWMDERKKLESAIAPKRRKEFFTQLVGWSVKQFPGTILVVSALFTLGSVAAIVSYEGDMIESDLSQVRSKESMESGSGYYQQYLFKIFKRAMSPFIILMKDRKDVPEVVAKIQEAQQDERLKGVIARVQTMNELVPDQQGKKISILRDIREIVDPEVRSRLPVERKGLAKKLLNPDIYQPVDEQDLPTEVVNRFRERDGSTGKIIVAEPPPDTSILHGDTLIRAVSHLRDIADSVQPGAPIAGQLPVTADIISSIRTSGPQATVIAFSTVIALVIILFRNASIATLILLPLLLGVLWLVGLMFHFGIKINFINFITLPITFGISVDYGINVLERYLIDKKMGKADILKTIKNTGGAVALASLTTIIGYGSLLLARNRGFVSFGLIAVLGEITCLFAALGTIPAYLWIKEKRLAAKKTATS